MRNLNETERENELRQCLIELSKSQECLKNSTQRKNFFLRLEEIYYKPNGKNFRHLYSNIFATVSMIEADGLNVLAQNMEIIKDNYEPTLLDNSMTADVSDEILKLYDHVNLDVARLNYLAQTFSKTESSLAELKEDSRRAKEGIKKAKNAEKNYITILGIFASIVLAFTGGLAFSTSVLENIQDVSPYRLAFVVEALVFMFINVIYILTWFIQKIHDSNVVKYPTFMIVLNVIIALAVLATAVCWGLGAAEKVELTNQIKLQQMIESN